MTRKIRLVLWSLALTLLAAVLLAVNLPEEKQAPTGAEVGERLPDFQISCLDGGEFKLSAHRGKVVVINLWATWCGPCVQELPLFDRLQQERPGEVAVLALHSPPVTTDVAAYLSASSYAIPFAVDEDGSLSKLLKASTVLPQTLVLDPEGVVTYNQSGALDYEKLLELVEAAKP